MTKTRTLKDRPDGEVRRDQPLLMRALGSTKARRLRCGVSACYWWPIASRRASKASSSPPSTRTGTSVNRRRRGRRRARGEGISAHWQQLGLSCTRGLVSDSFPGRLILAKAPAEIVSARKTAFQALSRRFLRALCRLGRAELTIGLQRACSCDGGGPGGKGRGKRLRLAREPLLCLAPIPSSCKGLADLVPV